MCGGRGREDARRGPRIADPAPAAIIAAGGSGERARTDPEAIPKQFSSLAGRPLWSWSAEALASFGCDPVVIVVPPEWVALTMDAVEGRATVVEGGSTRQGSVFNGLAAVDAPVVLVHDGARPFPARRIFDEVLARVADGFDGAVPGYPSGETLKEIERGAVVRTIDRAKFWAVQTPQAFVTETLKEAHRRARADGIDATDCAQLIELYGGRVAIVNGDPTNIKVTYPHDLEVAAALLARRPDRA